MQENLKNSQVRDALHRQKFYFRKSLVPEDEEEEPNDGEQAAKMAAVGDTKSHEDEYTLMDIDTIMNGKVLFVLSMSNIQSVHIHDVLKIMM